MPHAHDLTFLRLGRDFQAIRQRFALNDQGMIPGGGERIGHIAKKVLAVVADLRRFAVHDAVVDNHVPAERVADTLVAEANAQQRHFLPKSSNDVVGQTGFARRTGTGRDKDAFGIQFADLVEGNLVVASNFQRDLHLAQILDEVVGERIVIVYDQNHEAG